MRQIEFIFFLFVSRLFHATKFVFIDCNVLKFPLLYNNNTTVSNHNQDKACMELSLSQKRKL